MFVVFSSEGGGRKTKACEAGSPGFDATSRFQKREGKVSILGSNGKSATAGLPCIYQLITGQFFFSEQVKEDDNSYIFDSDKTLVIMIKPQRQGQAELTMVKTKESEFAPKQLRVPKTSVLMITDCGRPEIIQKAKEALSGIVLAGPGSN